MNYSKSVYLQQGAFESSLNYVDGGSKNAVIGFSGPDNFALTLEDGILYSSGKAIYSLDEFDSMNLFVAGNGLETTFWANNKPILSRPNNLRFNTIYCNSAGDFDIDVNIRGVQPLVSTSFSGWQNRQTGLVYIYNGGSGELEIDSAVLSDSFVRVESFPSSISPLSNGIAVLSYDSAGEYSGTGQIQLKTNAGEFSLDLFLQTLAEEPAGDLNIYLENSLFQPASSSTFFIESQFSVDKEVEIFFEFGYAGNPESGILDDLGNLLLTDDGLFLKFPNEFFDYWDFTVYDVDRGAEDFRTLNRFSSTYFGESGVKYRIPANQRVSGLIQFSGDGEEVATTTRMRVTDFNSLDYQAFISAL